MCKRPVLPTLFMERQSPRFPGARSSGGPGAGGQPPSCRNLGACRKLPARGWQTYQLTGKREREGGHPRLRVTLGIPAGARVAALGGHLPAEREPPSPAGARAEEGRRAGAPGLPAARSSDLPGTARCPGSAPRSAGSQPAVLAARTLVVLGRPALPPLFVVFRPESPSGFDSGGLRLASEVKRVHAQIEFLTNLRPEGSPPSHTKPVLPGQPPALGAWHKSVSPAWPIGPRSGC